MEFAEGTPFTDVSRETMERLCGIRSRSGDGARQPLNSVDDEPRSPSITSDWHALVGLERDSCLQLNVNSRGTMVGDSFPTSVPRGTSSWAKLSMREGLD
jgi:hypothetical protein